MQCPNGCDSPLESEQHQDETVNVLYWCEDCDLLAIWRRGYKLEILFPGIGREIDEMEDITVLT